MFLRLNILSRSSYRTTNVPREDIYTIVMLYADKSQPSPSGR